MLVKGKCSKFSESQNCKIKVLKVFCGITAADSLQCHTAGSYGVNVRYIGETPTLGGVACA